ncbi:hypothetical protein ACSNOI_24020 [Actinomadura kijaniata]|uniref:hypothetical protein n=1 Tax=Actinomadura kijaniata TaxID=46161 RepID=UPI003F1AFEFE
MQQRIPAPMQGRVSARVMIREIGIAPLSYLLVARDTAALGLHGWMAAFSSAFQGLGGGRTTSPQPGFRLTVTGQS